MKAFVHETATVEPGATIGSDTKVWHQTQIRRDARVGERCNIGKGVFIDFDVVIGDGCKLQNYACVYHGVKLGKGVFVGPHVVFTNDMYPRAVGPDFEALKDGDWEVGETVVEDGASIGANVTVLPSVRVGAWATIGAGAVVTRDVEPYALVVGTPARRIGWVCRCGRRVEEPSCGHCGDLSGDHPLRANLDSQSDREDEREPNPYR